uniref:Uncharacterized protein n=1 Tax=Manihot esculenta TaxID=3983 RepID=A0A2C9WK01_MANES
MALLSTHILQVSSFFGTNRAGLVGNSEPGSCKRLNLLFVSCQNLAETKMPRAPFFPLEIPLPNSCNPEVLPEETLSLSHTVRSPVREYSITELGSGFCLALPNPSSTSSHQRWLQ